MRSRSPARPSRRYRPPDGTTETLTLSHGLHRVAAPATVHDRRVAPPRPRPIPQRTEYRLSEAWPTSSPRPPRSRRRTILQRRCRPAADAGRGPPFDTATALVAGTAANTVTWYTGEMGTDPRADRRRQSRRRADRVVRGARQRAGDPLHDREYRGLCGDDVLGERSERAGSLHRDSQRVGSALAIRTGSRRSPTSRRSSPSRRPRWWTRRRASSRQRDAGDLLQGIELAPQEEVAAQMLALQTRLQASLQTTAMLYQLSIVHVSVGFLKICVNCAKVARFFRIRRGRSVRRPARG